MVDTCTNQTQVKFYVNLFSEWRINERDNKKLDTISIQMSQKNFENQMALCRVKRRNTQYNQIKENQGGSEG